MKIYDTEKKIGKYTIFYPEVPKDFDELCSISGHCREIFWLLYNIIKTTKDEELLVTAKKELSEFTKKYYGNLNHYELTILFGNYANFVKSWINKEI